MMSQQYFFLVLLYFSVTKNLFLHLGFFCLVPLEQVKGQLLEQQAES